MVLGVVLFLAVLQGATELFPVSSLGHAVIIPPLFHLPFRQSDADFVPLLVLLHIGTATALLILYRREWAAIIAGFFRAAARGSISDPAERMAMLLTVGTIPTAVVGFFAEKPVKAAFTNPRIAAFFLLCNAAVLAGAEILRRRDERRHGDGATRGEADYADAEQLSFRAALLVGLCQIGALLPGFSRSGLTMAAGLGAGLRHDQAVRFAFLLATPIILGAGVLEIPQISATGGVLMGYLAGAVVAGIIAYISARFLIRYFRSGRLDPFAAYCAVLGIIGLVGTH